LKRHTELKSKRGLRDPQGLKKLLEEHLTGMRRRLVRRQAALNKALRPAAPNGSP
jgi:hypothetical protein